MLNATLVLFLTAAVQPADTSAVSLPTLRFLKVAPLKGAALGDGARKRARLNKLEAAAQQYEQQIARLQAAHGPPLELFPRGANVTKEQRELRLVKVLEQENLSRQIQLDRKLLENLRGRIAELRKELGG